MSGKRPQRFSGKIIFANQLIGAASKKTITSSKQFQDLFLASADLVGALTFFDIPNMDFFVASRAADQFIVRAKDHGLDGSVVPRVSGLKLTCDGVKDSRGAVTTGRGDARSVVAEGNAIRPVGVLLDHQLFPAVRHL